MLGVRFGAVLALASVCAAQNSTSASTSSSASSSASSSLSTESTTLTAAARLPTDTTVTSTLNQTVTVTLVRNGSIEHCMILSDEWSSSSSAYEGTTSWVNYTTSSWMSTSTVYSNSSWECTMTCANLNAAQTSLCYAGPRTWNISTVEQMTTTTITRTFIDDYPVPTPNCTIGASVCMSLSDAWSATSSSIASNSASSKPPIPDRPLCKDCSSTACTFQHVGVNLYFWHVTTSVSRDYCTAWPETDFVPSSIWVPDVNHSYVPTTTGPYTVIDGITMYQGNVYLSIHEPIVRDNCGSEVPRASPGPNIVTIASSDLYSIRGYPNNLYPYSVSYADFNEPVPYSAWMGQSYCMRNKIACTVVWPGEYSPHMIMPPQIRTLDSNWANCDYEEYALFDPPIALKSVGDMFSSSATPTPPSTPDPVTTPPTPGQSGNDPGPTVTPPPVSDPPVDPPASNPPVDPPASNPPVDPPASNPPVDPPASNPPVNPPASSNPPNPPVDPPASNPPVNDPSASNPPTNDPPATNNNPPANNDPATNSPGPTPGQNPPQNPNPNPTNPPTNPQPPVVTIGDSTLTLDPTGGGLVLNPSSTLTPGAPPVTVGDQTLSVGSSGIVVIGPSGTSTLPVPIPTNENTPTTQQVTVGDETLTLINSDLVVGPGTTIAPGDPAVTIDGTTISVGTSGIVVQSEGGATTIVPTDTATPTNSAHTEEFTGGAASQNMRAWSLQLAGVLGAVVMLF